MIKRALKEYFFFGTAVRYLEDVASGTRIGNLGPSWMVRTNVEQLFRYMEALNLHVSARTHAARVLREVLGELKNTSDDAALTPEQAGRLNNEVAELRTTLEAELEGIDAYTVTPKRFDATLLLQTPEELLSPGLFERLPEIARYDFAEAARCVAYERPTAAAFHLLRSTEAVLRAFHAALVRRGRKARMWGEIVSDLRKRRAARSHGALLNHLDHVRLSFRNPTQHQEARYDMQEVQDLMGVCIDVINRMASCLTSA